MSNENHLLVWIYERRTFFLRYMTMDKPNRDNKWLREMVSYKVEQEGDVFLVVKSVRMIYNEGTVYKNADEKERKEYVYSTGSIAEAMAYRSWKDEDNRTKLDTYLFEPWLYFKD